MHVRHEALFRWLVERVPATAALRALPPRRPVVLPVDGSRPGAGAATCCRCSRPSSRPELDGHAAERLRAMCERYAGYIERERARLSCGEHRRRRDRGQLIERSASGMAWPMSRQPAAWRCSSCVADDPLAPTTVREPRRALDDHLADSLVALELAARSAAATTIADLGVGRRLSGPAAGDRAARARGRARREQRPQVRVPRARRSRRLRGRATRRRARARGGVAGRPRPLRPRHRPRAGAAGGGRRVRRAAAGVGGALVAWRGRRDPDDEAAAAAAAARARARGRLATGPGAAVSRRRHTGTCT